MSFRLISEKALAIVSQGTAEVVCAPLSSICTPTCICTAIGCSNFYHLSAPLSAMSTAIAYLLRNRVSAPVSPIRTAIKYSHHYRLSAPLSPIRTAVAYLPRRRLSASPPPRASTHALSTTTLAGRRPPSGTDEQPKARATSPKRKSRRAASCGKSLAPTTSLSAGDTDPHLSQPVTQTCISLRR